MVSSIVTILVGMIAPTVEGCKAIFKYMKRNYKYAKSMNKNFNLLETEKFFLYAKEDDVNRDLEKYKLNRGATRSCEIWLSEVEKQRAKIKKLESDYEDIGKFFCRLCPCPRHVKLGRLIVKMKEEVVSLKNQIGDQKRETVPVEKNEKAPALVIMRHAENIEKVLSLKKHVEMLEEYLTDEQLKRICIWGPPGVGKTTIMENLHDAIGKSKKFEIIIWATVDRGGDIISDLQKQILRRLNLHAEDRKEEIANMISEELGNKKYLLFLDEVSSEINLAKVGILDRHAHGRVIFASTNRDSCGPMDENIYIRGISDEDAENLFWKIVGVCLKDNRDIKKIAAPIIKYCGGIPGLIKIIGSSLKNVGDPAIWRAKLKEIRSPSKTQKQELEDFYIPFKVEYDKLDEDVKICLLYWAVFPAGCELHRDYIIECWRAEQFFKDFTKLGEARDRGHAILDEFVKKSLVEKGGKVAHYKMIEYFQRVALRIANSKGNSCKILVKESEMIKEEEWKHANRISLVDSCNSTLPQWPKCCGMLTLLIQGSGLKEIPTSFFGYMCGLHLLHLHNTEIRLIPSSISSLINLKALFLEKCNQLMQLPAEVGDLHTLEIFDIRSTGIHSLPAEIGQLTNLKCLKVSFSKTDENDNHVEIGPKEMIYSHIIAGLHSLEELSIDVDPTITSWNQNAKNIVAKVAALKDLSAIRFYFPEVDCFQEFIEARKSCNGNNTQWSGNDFRSFNILVGYHPERGPLSELDVTDCSAEKLLRFSAGQGFPDSVLKILEQACIFELIGHQNAANLSNFGADNLKGLEACIIKDCSEMTSIIDGDHVEGLAFQSLNKLYLNNLPKLVQFWNGSIQIESLFMLTTLKLKKCHSLKTLFSQNVIERLNQLNNLQVDDCRVIGEIIKDDCIVSDSNVFPKLKNIQLVDLPNLYSISLGSLTWPSLETIIIWNCDALSSFPYTFQEATKIREIECSQTWWDRLDWPNNVVKDRFQGLQKFI